MRKVYDTTAAGVRRARRSGVQVAPRRRGRRASENPTQMAAKWCGNVRSDGQTEGAPADRDHVSCGLSSSSKGSARIAIGARDLLHLGRPPTSGVMGQSGTLSEYPRGTAARTSAVPTSRRVTPGFLSPLILLFAGGRNRLGPGRTRCRRADPDLRKPALLKRAPIADARLSRPTASGDRTTSRRQPERARTGRLRSCERFPIRATS